MAVRGERENRLMNRGTRLLEPMDLPRGGYRTVGGTVPCQLLVNSTEVYVPYHESLLLPRCHCRGADERRLNAAFHRFQEHRARKRSRLTLFQSRLRNKSLGAPSLVARQRSD